MQAPPRFISRPSRWPTPWVSRATEKAAWARDTKILMLLNLPQRPTPRNLGEDALVLRTRPHPRPASAHGSALLDRDPAEPALPALPGASPAIRAEDRPPRLPPQLSGLSTHGLRTAGVVLWTRAERRWRQRDREVGSVGSVGGAELGSAGRLTVSAARRARPRPSSQSCAPCRRPPSGFALPSLGHHPSRRGAAGRLAPRPSWGRGYC